MEDQSKYSTTASISQNRNRIMKPNISPEGTKKSCNVFPGVGYRSVNLTE